MTPALLTLARQLAALPGAPRQDHPGYVTVTGQRQPDGRWRTPEGYLWVWDDETTQMVLDLADPATGGVLLNLIPPLARWRIKIEDDGFVTVHASAGIREIAYDVTCPTLAEACARVLVAIGRVG